MLRCMRCFSHQGAQGDVQKEDDTATAFVPASSSTNANGQLDKALEPRFEDTYDTLYQIGEGKTGQVYVVKKKKKKQQLRTGAAETLAEKQLREREWENLEVAAKVVRQEYLSTPNRVEALQSELTILARVKHPGILRLREVFHDNDKVVIVTDKAKGGELLDAICRPEAPRLRECDVAEIVRQLLNVLAYLHLNGITHRDVKIENILCKSRTWQDGVVLIDFGLAHMSTVGGSAEMSGMNGTPHYMAPEMFRKTGCYDCAIDLWALGVVTYILLFGRFPFDAKFLSQVEDKISQGEFEYPAEFTSQVSPQAKKFIEYLLVLNPRERPPAALALQHPWLQADAAPSTFFTEEHMAALAKYSEGKKVFIPPATSTEYLPPDPVAKKRIIIHEGKVMNEASRE
uniref:Protein kinase domain-containing protein n=1 Tax=Hyaloperonospora arabidopsidis (strain Emoy2) TaxID=559515 RepID=M4B1X6_HYAAE